MKDDFKEKVKDLLKSEDEQCKGDCFCGFAPPTYGMDLSWTMLLLLILLFDKDEEKKESPVVINLYFGVDD